MGQGRRAAAWFVGAALCTAAALAAGGSASAQTVGAGGGEPSPETLDAPGSQNSSQHITGTQFDNLGFNIYNRIQEFSGGGGANAGGQTSRRPGGVFGKASGIAAGEGSLANGVWANVALNRLSDDTKGLTAEGNTVTGIIGYDRLFGEDRWLVGLGVIVDNSNFSTLYNAGDLSSTSFGVVPYVAWRATDELTFNLVTNYSFGSTDATRITPTGAGVTGEYDIRRWFVQGGMDYEIIRGRWAFIARTELSYGEESNDSYTESNGNLVGEQTNVLGTWRVGGQVGYTFTLDDAGGGFAEPYMMFGYELDFERTKIRVPVGVAGHANDNDQFNIGGGVNVYVGDNWSANVEGMGALGRADIGNWILSGTLRYQF